MSCLWSEFGRLRTTGRPRDPCKGLLRWWARAVHLSIGQIFGLQASGGKRFAGCGMRYLFRRVHEGISGCAIELPVQFPQCLFRILAAARQKLPRSRALSAMTDEVWIPLGFTGTDADTRSSLHVQYTPHIIMVLRATRSIDVSHCLVARRKCYSGPCSRRYV